MDDRPIVWDDANRKHLGSDHPERHISITEIEEVLHNADRVETDLAARQADRDGRYPIHAREATKRIIRRINK